MRKLVGTEKTQPTETEKQRAKKKKIYIYIVYTCIKMKHYIVIMCMSIIYICFSLILPDSIKTITATHK